jgi:L-2-hydroxycarboxylate dehydrogenase (NAD+)
MAETHRLPTSKAESFMHDVFVALGVPDEDAEICTKVLISSDLRGIESHGIGRLKYYYDRIRAGIQHTTTDMEIVSEGPATALVDGHHGMGHVIAYRSMELAIAKARDCGLGGVAVRNSTHFGIAGYYALMAAEADMMGFVVSNTRPSVAPTFSTEPLLGTNPIAFAAPSDGPHPFCFDGATSITQRGKIEVAARAGAPLQPEWVIGPDGKPLRDAQEVLQRLDSGEAALLPIGGPGERAGGHKGYGLSVLVEILSASLTGGAFLTDLLGVAEDGSRRPHMLGHFFLAIDVGHFLPVDRSRETTGAIMRALGSAQLAPGAERVFLAGEKEYLKEQSVPAEGVPVNDRLRSNLQTMRDELGIAGYEDYF